nr:ribonuclease H-like domain-containing protein [Tanacetum cinerariifolium]
MKPIPIPIHDTLFPTIIYVSRPYTIPSLHRVISDLATNPPPYPNETPHQSPTANTQSGQLDPNWCNAMYDEYNTLVKNSTWILVPRPSGVNLVRSMWLFKHKFHADGILSRYKARLVANSSNQQLGVDFDETFSPVVKTTTIRTVLSLVVSCKWLIHQLDVKNAFLNGDLSETVYMHHPPIFLDSRYPHHVCLLQRSLYRLKQAPRAWFYRFAGYATRFGFYHTRCDSSLFIYRQGSHVAYLLIYVDDIIVTAFSAALLQQIIDSLNSEFDMTDLGALNYFLGISVVRHPTRFFCLSESTLLSSFNRTLDFGLQLYASATTSRVGYTDVDWAGFPSTRKSTPNYCVFWARLQKSLGAGWTVGYRLAINQLGGN